VVKWNLVSECWEELATIAEGEPQKLEHNDIKWIAPNEISNYEFCLADEEPLEK
jgi:8-oxo-dGTP diphosphatase